MTWSTLKLVPTDDDDQSVISCVASNTYFPADTKEQQITLNVHCTFILLIRVRPDLIIYFNFRSFRSSETTNKLGQKPKRLEH